MPWVCQGWVRVLRRHYQHSTVGRSTSTLPSPGALQGSPGTAWGCTNISSSAGTRGWLLDRPHWLSSSLCPGLRLLGPQCWQGVCVSSHQSPSLQGCWSSFHAVCLRLFLLEVPGCECPHRAGRRVRVLSPDSSSAAVLEELGWGLAGRRVKSTQCHRESLYRWCVCLSRSGFPLTVFPRPKMETNPSLSPGSSKYLGSSMQDTAAEERGRQRRDLDFPGEYSVELDSQNSTGWSLASW